MSKLSKYKKVMEEQIEREGMTKDNKLINHILENVTSSYTLNDLMDFFYISDNKAKWGRRLYAFSLSENGRKIFSLYHQ